MMNCFSFKSPVGWLTVKDENGCLCELSFGKSENSGEMSQVAAEVVKQLGEYFAGARKSFDVKLSPKGTEFQKRVWKALCDIPYGETRSYKEIAEAVGNVKACRAVGMANNRNPIVIIIPCHRVVGSDGSLTGYGGGLDKKEFLLKLEQQNI